MCQRWEDFFAFLEDMGRRPSFDHTLERKDTDGNYEPDNCVWATREEQGANKRNNVRVLIAGDEIVLAHALRLIGKTRSVIECRRRNRNETLQEAIDHYAKLRGLS